jgi:glycosyltransferase involved in cell wall biosynthesis
MADSVMTSPQLKICFVSPYIYPLFNPQNKTMFGGFEVRVYQIARDLASRGNFRVSIIVADHGQPHHEIREVVELVSWNNLPFFGISAPPLPALNPVPKGEQTNISRSVDQADSGFAARITEWYSPSENRLAKATSTHLSSVRQLSKQLYKSVLPWKTRILIHGFVSGFKAAGIHFAQGFRRSLDMWRESTMQNLQIARKSFSEINDEPVYPEAVEIFEEVNADIYIVPGNHWIAARVASYCRKRRRAYVMMIGSDKDLLPEIKDNPSGIDVFTTPHALKLYSINHADIMIVQNENQVELAGYFGISPVLIRNPVNLERMFPKTGNTNHILWVGNTRESVKRPSLMLEVARRLSQFRFTMIVTIVEQDDYDQIMRAASELPNLTVLTSVPFSEVEKYFASSKVFVNTSNFEGLPNTFLQAGKYAVPVASLKVDPNHMFTQYHCGPLCNDNLDVLVENILKLMYDPQFYELYSQNILDYVKKFHDQELITSQYEKTFRMVGRRKKYLTNNW